MARESDTVQVAYQAILTVAEKISNRNIRSKVLAILDNPAPTIAYGNERAILQALENAGLTAVDAQRVFPPVRNKDQSPRPFWSAWAPATALTTPIRVVLSRTRH